MTGAQKVNPHVTLEGSARYDPADQTSTLPRRALYKSGSALSETSTLSYRSARSGSSKQSSFDQFLDYEVALRVGQVKERTNPRGPVKYEGVCIRLNNDGRNDLRLTPIASTVALMQWLDETDENESSDDGWTSMRLLVHFWPEKSSSRTPFPFESEAIASRVIENLGLPRNYLYILARNSYAPFRLQRERGDERIHISCQSPQFANYFTSMALSYEPKKGSISGLLCLESSQSALLYHLQQLNTFVAHPLLLPILIFRQSTDFHQTRSQMASNMMDSVQSGTGLLHRSFFFAPEMIRAPSPEIGDDGTTDRLHEMVVNAHGHLTHGAMYFLDDLSTSIRQALEEISSPLSQEETASLKSLFEITSSEAKIAINHKETLIARMNVQLQALYNIMQQNAMKQARRDVQITMKDSARMKAIALLTMVFLPSTALATIFSMSTFFSTDEDGGLHILPIFWVFWAISLPITVLVLALYLLWIRHIDRSRT